MSEQRKSLLRSSISIKSIRSSATQFSKSLQRSNILASQIAKGTRQSNIFNSKMISKENEYFRKRRENVRRKDREDELEASSVSGVTKREGNILQKSTKGFLGRILDFFGIVLIGWFVNRLPGIIKAIGNVINLIKRAVGFLTGFIDGIKDFLTGVGDGIRAAIDALPKFDFLQFKNESEKTLKETEDRARKLNDEFRFGLQNFGKDVTNSMEDPDVDPSTGLLYYGDDAERQMQQQSSNQNQENNEEEGSSNETDENTKETGDGTLISGVTIQDEKLQIEEESQEQKNIALLKKIDGESKKIGSIYDKEDKIVKGIEDSTQGFGTDGTPPPTGAVEAGAFTEATEEDTNREKKLDSEDGETTDDNASMGTPEVGDYFVTKGGQGNKQTFYHVLQPNGKIKSLGKNKRPDGGSQFSRSQIVAVGNNIKQKNVNGIPTDESKLTITAVSIDGKNILVDSAKKNQYNLEMMFKKDRPTIILKDFETIAPNIKPPSFTSGGTINFEVSKSNDGISLGKIHSLILEGI